MIIRCKQQIKPTTDVKKLQRTCVCSNSWVGANKRAVQFPKMSSLITREAIQKLGSIDQVLKVLESTSTKVSSTTQRLLSSNNNP